MSAKSIRAAHVAAALAIFTLPATAAPASSAAEGPGPAAPRPDGPVKPGRPAKSAAAPPFASAKPGRSGSVIPGHYVVALRDSVAHPGDVARAQTARQGGKLGFVYSHALKGYSAELTKGAVEALRRDPRVRYVTPDRRIEADAQTIPSGVERVHAPENPVADIDGEDDQRVNADVAVIDTDSVSNSDLNVYKRTDCSDLYGTHPGECIDGSGPVGPGHGTHVAGIIGALDNEIGVVGVAPGVRIWSVKVFEGGQANESWIVAGVDWVTAHASEIEVANMSLGCACSLPAVEDAISGYEEGGEHVPGSVDEGVVYTVSAGNSNVDAKYQSPAKNPDVITVSALADYDGKLGGEAEPLTAEECEAEEEGTHTWWGRDDVLAYFSNYGEEVDVAAPGVCIYSTWNGGGYEYESGTSMAAPHVAGAAAILASESNPNSKEDVEAIRQQIVDAGNQSWVEFWDDEDFGYSHDEVQEPLLDLRQVGARTYTTMATDVFYYGATLNGGVNPAGASTTYQFEYGPTTEYGESAPGSAEEAGSGGTDIKLSADVEELEPDTIYHYRLATTNEETEKTSYGDDRTFSTSTVLTRAATGRGAHSVRLEGTLNPAGVSSSYQFEYGKTTDYGHTTPESAESVGSGTEDVEVSQPIAELSPSTLYHFRLVKTNNYGTVYGKDRIFRTPNLAFTTEPRKFPTIEGAGYATSFYIGLIPEYEGTTITCDTPKLSASLEGSWFDVLAPAAANTNCYAFSFAEKPRAWKMNGCRFEFHPETEVNDTYYLGTADIGPPSCGPMSMDLEGECELQVGPQTGLGASFEVDGEGSETTMQANVYAYRALRFTLTTGGCGFFQPKGTYDEGALQASWTLSAEDSGKNPLGLLISDVPEASTGSISEVGAKKATLHAGIKTKGLPTIYDFEFGTSEEYGEEGAVGFIEEGGEGTTQVSGQIEGLEPHTTYHYRVLAYNEAGLLVGGDRKFTTDGRHTLRFDAGSFPMEIEGNSTEEKFEFGIGYVECDLEDFSPEVTEPAGALRLDARQQECFGLGNPKLKTTVAMNSCRYVFSLDKAGPPYTGTMGIACEEEGDAIEVVVLKENGEETKCELAYGPQQGVPGVSYETVGEGLQQRIEVDAEVEELQYTSSGGLLNCGVGNGTHTNGVYVAEEELWGYEIGEGLSVVGLFISGEPTVGTYLAGEESEEEAEQPRLEAESFPWRWRAKRAMRSSNSASATPNANPNTPARRSPPRAPRCRSTPATRNASASATRN